MRDVLRKCSLTTLALAGTLMGAPLAQAQEEVEPVPGSRVFGSLTVDVQSAYFFFGIPQENQGIIVQPTGTIGLNLITEGPITVDGYVGVFNSFHFDNPTGEGGDNFWYEGDPYAGFVFGFPGGVWLDISYWIVNSPAAGVEFNEEIDIFAGIDDTPFWESVGVENFALSPYVGLVVETDGGADGLGEAGEKGTLFLVGIEPAFPLVESEEMPVTLSFPTEAGFDVDDYYENSLGEDETFGYFQVGAQVSAPLAFIPVEYGEWEGHLGVHHILLGDGPQAIGETDFGVLDGSDHFFVKAGVGLSF